MLNITTDVGNELLLTFNPTKSAIVIFAEDGIGNERPLYIHGKELPVEKSYKYLGMVLDDSRDYLSEQEKIWEDKSARALRQLHAQSLWAFNRFEISRVHWKAVAVPKITYGNAVTTMSRKTRSVIETPERSS